MARRKYVKENNLVKAINTDSLELQKPLANEYYDINVHNSNMDKIDLGYKQNKNDISNINYELSKTENTKYSTENGVKEFSCKNGYVDNVVIEGKTLVNLVRNEGAGNFSLDPNGTRIKTFNNVNFVGDKVYTLFFNIKSNLNNMPIRFNHLISNGVANNIDLCEAGYTGIILKTITMKTNYDGIINIFAQSGSSGIAVIENILLIEGDHTDKPISYFEGLKSVGQGDKIEVLSHNGKNFDYGSLSFTNGIKLPTSGVHTDNDDWKYSNYIKVNPNTDYLLKYVSINVNFYDINKNIIPSDYQEFLVENVGDISIGHVYIKTPSNCEYIIIHRRHINTTPIEMYTVSLYDKKQISTTLRSLPNGVKDTIEKRGNKYYKIKRCVECNPREITYFGGKETYYQIELKISDLPQIANNSIISNLFGNFGNTGGSKDTVFIHPTYEKTIVIQTTNPSITTKELAQTYIENNNLTVVYELETPIIEELPNFNPQTFSDKTTLLLNTGVVQGEANFEVTNSLGSELEVLKSKVSDLYDNVVEIEKINLLNGWSNIVNEAYVIKNKNVVTLSMSIGGGITTNATTIGVISDKFRPKSFKDGYSQFGCVSCDSGYVYSPATIVVWDNGKINADVITSNKRLVINASWYV